MMPVPDGVSPEEFNTQMEELRAKKAETRRILERLVTKSSISSEDIPAATTVPA